MRPEPISLLPFVPSGSDFKRSCTLFEVMGFKKIWENDGFAGFQNGPAKFILQDIDIRSFSENVMLKLEVPDIDSWWKFLRGKKLPELFEGFQIKPPKDYPWGREIHFIDLAGVCWHIGNP